MDSKNNIWFEDTSILFNKHNFFDIIPSINMNFNEKVNAILRFVIYLSIILIIVTGKLNYIYLPISIMLIFYLVYIFKPKSLELFNLNHNNNENNEDNENNENNQDNENNEDNEDNEDNKKYYKPILEPEEDLTKCRKPTKNNPLMNLQISDFTSENNQRACNVNNPKISEVIDENFDDKLYLNTEVVYNTKYNQRDFYTMPNTRSYSDQGAFANWLYNTPVSCAQGKTTELKQVRACSFNNKKLEEIE